MMKTQPNHASEWQVLCCDCHDVDWFGETGSALSHPNDENLSSRCISRLSPNTLGISLKFVRCTVCAKLIHPSTNMFQKNILVVSWRQDNNVVQCRGQEREQACRRSAWHLRP